MRALRSTATANGNVMALDWRPKKVSKETTPSPKHVHPLEEGDQGLTDGLHTKVGLTVVATNKPLTRRTQQLLMFGSRYRAIQFVVYTRDCVRFRKESAAWRCQGSFEQVHRREHRPCW